MLIFRGLPGSADPYVKIGVFNSPTFDFLQMVDTWSQANRKPVNVNAIDNGVHGANGRKWTFHGLSLAWDVTPSTGAGEDYVALAKYLQLRLPSEYQVIVESDHIHVEWDTGLGR